MTRRKPAGVSFGDWVQYQIVDAERRGLFEDLPGKGEPLPGRAEAHDDLAWIAAKLRRENVDISALLPPALALAKEIEDLPALLSTLRSEAGVRALLEDLNERIRRAHRIPHDGPPVRVMPLDVDDQVRCWATARNPVASVEPVPPAAARRGFRLRRRVR